MECILKKRVEVLLDVAPGALVTDGVTVYMRFLSCTSDNFVSLTTGNVYTLVDLGPDLYVVEGAFVEGYKADEK